MKKTLKYYLNKRLLFIAIITGIVFLLTVISIGEGEFITKKSSFIPALDTFVTKTVPQNVPFGFSFVIAGILATVIPVYEFNFKMNKIVVDQVFSLPIKKEKYYLSKYIVGLIEVLVPVLVSLIYSFIRVVSSNHLYDLSYFIPMLLCLLLVTTLIYSIFVFFYTRANTVLDGIVNICFSMFFLLGISTITKAMFIPTSKATTYEYIIYLPLWIVYDIFDCLMIQEAVNSVGFTYANKVITYSEWSSLITYLVLGIISVFGLIYFAKKDKAEDSMQLSDSIFSYKFFVPYYIFFLSFIIGMARVTLIDSIVYIGVAGFIGYVCYRRTIKIQKIDLIFLFASLIAGIIIGTIFEM